MFELQWPWLLLLLPCPLFILYFWKPVAQREKAALQLPFYRNVMNAAKYEHNHTPYKKQKHLWFPWLIWILLLLAASRPQWIGDPVQIEESGRDLMLAVDLSGSMEINDMALKGSAVDRLTIAKDVLADFIIRRTGDRIGLILFGSKAYLQTPLTFDRKTVKTLLDESSIGIAGNKTAIGDAIGLAVKHLRKRPEQSRVLILLTDGANTAGEISPLQGAELAKKHHIKVYTIGMGADEMIQPGLFGSSFGARKVNPSADLDEKTLKDIAGSTGGQYFRAKNTDELNSIYDLLDELEPVAQEKALFRPSIALYYWPLGLALLLCFAYTLWVGYLSEKIQGGVLFRAH
ncbi:hypothetical protein CI610_01933 [invertebrate metagenome]|uniref:VWFA domain-containing protein n=1 Tax=invertebrate metagenome TaxID=1711999 RepID=A0A2H9T7B6_9ZZZZ